MGIPLKIHKYGCAYCSSVQPGSCASGPCGREDRGWHRPPRFRSGKDERGRGCGCGPCRDGNATAVSVGDTVLLPEYGGSKISIDGGDNLFLFHDDDIPPSSSSKPRDTK